ncbi:hypothetical protein CUR86_02845 [Salinicola acroporae]|uniref:Uncharacterized protein n=1 Tax=Salinicola acroporae TaxID=1541440 RepID=A0ABT6I2F8_9GAMM|nr:hypothetical protein [Salinicola acroporae]
MMTHDQATVRVSNRLPQHRIRIAQRRGDDLQGVLQRFAALGSADGGMARGGQAEKRPLQSMKGPLIVISPI